MYHWIIHHNFRGLPHMETCTPNENIANWELLAFPFYWLLIKLLKIESIQHWAGFCQSLVASLSPLRITVGLTHWHKDWCRYSTGPSVWGFRMHERHAKRLTIYTQACYISTDQSSISITLAGPTRERCRTYLWYKNLDWGYLKADERRLVFLNLLFFFLFFVLFQMCTWLFWKMLSYQSLTRGMVETWWLHIILFCCCFTSLLFHFI